MSTDTPVGDDCPHCFNNRGWDYSGPDAEQVQCEWCWDNPNSHFNVSRTSGIKKAVESIETENTDKPCILCVSDKDDIRTRKVHHFNGIGQNGNLIVIAVSSALAEQLRGALAGSDDIKILDDIVDPFKSLNNSLEALEKHVKGMEYEAEAEAAREEAIEKQKRKREKAFWKPRGKIYQ
jgi:hypothetical protein